MVIINNTNDEKHQQEWKENIKRLAMVLAETKQNELTTLLTDRTKLDEERQALVQEITALESKKTSLKNVFAYHRGANEKLTELKANPKPADKFLGNGGNKYNWRGKSQAYYPATYENNLYEGTVNGQKTKITEQEAIKLITRAIKACQKIDATKFTAKSNSHASLTSAPNTVKDGTILKEIQTFAKDGLKSNEIIGQDANGNDLPNKGKPANHKWLDRLEYSFKSQYVTDADIKKDITGTAFISQTTEVFNHTKLTNFFTLIENISKDGTINPDFLAELNTDADILKEVENNTIWKIIPAQSSPYLKIDGNPLDLDRHGLKLADKSKTNLYLNDKPAKAIKFYISEGLKSWVELVNGFFADAKNRTKLINSFTNDPYLQLLNDIRDNTHDTNWELPEDIDDLQDLVDELEMDKFSSSHLNATLMSEITKKTEEKNVKQDQITPKDQEIDKIVKEILDKKRAELTKWEISKGFKKTNTADNRRNLIDLSALQSLLCTIRYLENDGDATQASSEGAENTALNEITTILQQQNQWYLVDTFHTLSLVKGGEGKQDITQAIDRIKAGKYTDSDGQERNLNNNVTEFLAHFKAKTELVKLTDWENQAHQALQIAEGEKQDDTETLTDWQTKLKTLDNSLDETVITPDFKSKWNKVNKFKNLVQVEELVKKILDSDQKIKSDFFTEINKGKEDSQKINDLKTLLSKEPKEVITLIMRYEYDKNTKEKKDKEVKVIKMNMDKKKEDAITEEEITTGLYKLAVGEYSQKSDSEIQKWETGKKENQGEQKPKGFFRDFFRKDNPWMWGTLGAIVVALLGTAYYFVSQDQSKPEEESETEKEEME